MLSHTSPCCIWWGCNLKNYNLRNFMVSNILPIHRLHWLKLCSRHIPIMILSIINNLDTHLSLVGSSLSASIFTQSILTWKRLSATSNAHNPFYLTSTSTLKLDVVSKFFRTANVSSYEYRRKTQFPWIWKRVTWTFFRLLVINSTLGIFFV